MEKAAKKLNHIVSIQEYNEIYNILINYKNNMNINNIYLNNNNNNFEFNQKYTNIFLNLIVAKFPLTLGYLYALIDENVFKYEKSGF